MGVLSLGCWNLHKKKGHVQTFLFFMFSRGGRTYLRRSCMQIFKVLMELVIYILWKQYRRTFMHTNSEKEIIIMFYALVVFWPSNLWVLGMVWCIHSPLFESVTFRSQTHNEAIFPLQPSHWARGRNGELYQCSCVLI